MSPFTSRAQLVRVVLSLAKRLPIDLGSLLGAGRFDAERLALTRLAEPSHAWAAARSMSEAEAQWLSEVLRERWAEIGSVELDPFVAVVAPERVWLSRGVNSVRFEVAVDGLDEGQQVQWTGSLWKGGAVAQSVVIGELLLTGDGVPGDIYARVAVDGRAAGKRVLLVDEVVVRVSVPVLIINDDRTQLIFADHLERRAVEANVRVGQTEYRTDRHGMLRLDTPAEPGATVSIEGVRAGSVPGAPSSAGHGTQR